MPIHQNNMPINLNNGLWGDQKPIVLFFGETGSGKTTALVRLITYLHQTEECSYELCKKFHEHYYGDEPISTVYSEFTKQFDVEIQKVEGTALSCLCRIKDAGGNVLCRFLDTPGENLFSVNNDIHRANVMQDRRNVPIFGYQYLNEILDTEDYQKVWIFFMDLDMLLNHKAYADEYIVNITRIAKRIEGKGNDKMIFVVNKEDRVREKYGPVLERGCEAYVNNLFNNILTRRPFTTETSILGFKRKKKHFRVIPFCSYTVEVKYKDMYGNQLPTEYKLSSEVYPTVLWQTIKDAFLNKF